jgi:NAD(P)-dependent dehydrogenase (short-subunit alcohol dehydrogenase family)
VAGSALDRFTLAGRVALVTGGSKGIGQAMARGLASVGADVVIVSRHRDELEAALAEILDGSGARGVCIEADLSRRGAVDYVVDEAQRQIGRVDILVNNVGANVPQTIDKVSDEEWDAVVELNLSSSMSLTRAFAPQMRSRGWGRIIYVTSIMAFASKEGRATYSATKTALIGLARASAIDLGRFGITVNCIAPGLIVTRLTEGNLSQEDRELHLQRTALGRPGDPDELVGPLLALVSDAGSYVTGTTLVVDGGWTIG